MNCANHPENEATGTCVYCGKLFCKECLVDVNGKNHCRDCVNKAFEDMKNSSTSNIIPNININNVSTSASNSVANANTNGVGGFQVSPKSRLVATLLCGIGWIIDIVLLLTGSFRDNYGMYIKTW